MASYSHCKTHPSSSAPNWKEPSCESRASYPLSAPTHHWKYFPKHQWLQCGMHFLQESITDLLHVTPAYWFVHECQGTKWTVKVSCGNLYADKWSTSGYVLSAELKSLNYCFVHTVVMPFACRRLPRGLTKGRKKEILRTWEKLLYLILNVKKKIWLFI